MAYATAAQVKAYLGITGTGDDDLIADLVQRATAAIETYTNREFEAARDTTRTLDAIGRHVEGYTLYLDRDLCQITTVTNGDGTTVSSSNYVTIPRNDTPYYGIQIKRTAGVVWTYSTDWEGAISITGRWGYSVEPPADIVQACVRLAAFMYRQKDAPIMAATAIEAGVVVRPEAMPADVRAALMPYKRLM